MSADTFRAPTARSDTSPSTNFPVAGSRPREPEQKTRPLEMMAWDMKGAAGGALGVMTAVLEAIVMRYVLAI